MQAVFRRRAIPAFLPLPSLPDVSFLLCVLPGKPIKIQSLLLNKNRLSGCSPWGGARWGERFGARRRASALTEDGEGEDPAHGPKDSVAQPRGRLLSFHFWNEEALR